MDYPNYTKKMVLLVLVLCLSVQVYAAQPDGLVDIRTEDNYDDGGLPTYFVNQDPDPVAPGSFVDVRWKVESSFGAIDDLVISIDPQYPFTLDPSTPKLVSLGKVNSYTYGRDAYIVRYRLQVDKNAPEGNHRIDLKYSKDGGNTWVALNPFYVQVQVRRPNIAIGSITSSPDRVQPGGETLMRVEVVNEVNVLLKDIRVKLDLSDDVPFAPLDSSNEKIIRSLEALESSTVEFRLIAESDAEAKIYKVPIVVEYADSSGNNFTRESLTALIIGATPDLVVTAETSDLVTTGKKTPVSVRFINKGPTGIKFLYATLKETSDFKILSSNEAYIGKIDSDDYQTAEFTIYINGNAKNPLILPVELAYSDATNKEYSLTKEIPLSLFSAGDAKRYANGGTSPVIGVVIVIVIVIVGVLIFRWWRKRKKH